MHHPGGIRRSLHRGEAALRRPVKRGRQLLAPERATNRAIVLAALLGAVIGSVIPVVGSLLNSREDHSFQQALARQQSADSQAQARAQAEQNLGQLRQQFAQNQSFTTYSRSESDILSLEKQLTNCVATFVGIVDPSTAIPTGQAAQYKWAQVNLVKPIEATSASLLKDLATMKIVGSKAAVAAFTTLQRRQVEAGDTCRHFSVTMIDSTDAPAGQSGVKEAIADVQKLLGDLDQDDSLLTEAIREDLGLG